MTEYLDLDQPDLRPGKGRLTRLPQTLIVLVLLAATAAAFAVTERLKLEKSPITGTQVTKIFSPVCECTNDVAVVSFRLRKPEKVTVTMLDSVGKSVATLVRGQRERPGRVSYTWDGRDQSGQLVPEGRYRPRVELAAHGRTIVLPNTIDVDETPPTVHMTSVSPRVFMPGSRGRSGRVVVRYAVDEHAQALLLVNGQRRVMTRFRPLKGTLVWYGRLRGRTARPGTYELRLRAIDRAGNRSLRTRAVSVRVRYIELVRKRIRAVAGKRFSVRVSTDALRYRWVFAGKKGSTRKKVLVLRAPKARGVYPLYVVYRHYADRGEVVVAAHR